MKKLSLFIFCIIAFCTAFSIDSYSSKSFPVCENIIANSQTCETNFQTLCNRNVILRIKKSFCGTILV